MTLVPNPTSMLAAGLSLRLGLLVSVAGCVSRLPPGHCARFRAATAAPSSSAPPTSNIPAMAAAAAANSTCGGALRVISAPDRPAWIRSIRASMR